MYAWPEASLHVDPLKFSRTTMDSYTIVESVRGSWLDELARWQVKTVIIKAKSPMARALKTAPGWSLWYADSTAAVYRANGT